MAISVEISVGNPAINDHCCPAFGVFRVFLLLAVQGQPMAGPSPFFGCRCARLGTAPPCLPGYIPLHTCHTPLFRVCVRCTAVCTQGGMVALFASQKHPALGLWPRTSPKNDLPLEKEAKGRVPLPLSSPSGTGPWPALRDG